MFSYTLLTLCVLISLATGFLLEGMLHHGKH
jgi:hypothetical protein